MASIITLLTDFGTRDAYVAAMKGVILGLNPQAVLVDLTHEVPPQDILAGAFILAEAAPYFPEGAIHLAVVDPGVGTGRRGLAARARGRFWVGPDNGLLSLALGGAPEATIVSLTNPACFRPEVSATFHGRDIFAPVAAHLSLGVDLARLGPIIRDPVALPIAEPVFTPAEARGEIIYVDRFGNLVSNLPGRQLATWLAGRDFRLRVGPLTISQLSRTYSEVAAGECLVLIGSHGFLEIACNRESAARRLGLGVGAILKILY
jgi:hypothetical protein